LTLDESSFFITCGNESNVIENLSIVNNSLKGNIGKLKKMFHENILSIAVKYSFHVKN